MEWFKTKKIKITKGYFQVSLAKSPEYGESIAITLIPTKQQMINNRQTPVPDYENRITFLLSSFNIASKVAAYFRSCSQILLLEKKEFSYSITMGKKGNQRTILFSNKIGKQKTKVTFSNESELSLEFDFGQANVAADLMNARMYEMEVIDSIQDEDTTDEIAIKTQTKEKPKPKEEPKQKIKGAPTDKDIQEFKRIRDLCIDDGFFNVDGVQGYIEQERKQGNKASSLTMVKDLADKLKVKY